MKKRPRESKEMMVDTGLESIAAPRGLRLSRLSWMAPWMMISAVGCATTPIHATSLVEDEELSDNSITDAIEDEIMLDQSVVLNDIDISTLDGVVTLTGQTSTLLAKDRAARIAETVKGVRSVINRIEVKPFWSRVDWETCTPPSTPWDSIRLAVFTVSPQRS